MQTQRPEDFGNEYRQRLQQINSQAYNEAAAEQAEKNGNLAPQDDTTSAKDSTTNTTYLDPETGKPLVEGKSIYAENNPSVQGINSVDGVPFDQIKPIGTGAFGNVYNQFKGKPKEAVAFLIQQQGGEALGALHYDAVGDVGLVWGKAGTKHSDGFGLAKLVKYHPEVVANLQDILSSMKVDKASPNRVNLSSDKYQAAIRLDYDGKSKTWLLTAYEKELPSDSSKTTDTATSLLSGDTALTQSEGNSSTDKGTHNSLSGNGSEATLTFEDGTPVPMKADSKGRNVADYSQMTPEHGAEWIKRSFGENADKVVDGKIKKAEAALKEAEKIKIDYSADDADIIEAEAKKKEAVDAAQRDLDFFTRVKNAMKKKENLEGAGGTGATGGRYEQWRKDGYYIGEGGVRYDRQKKEDQTGVYGREVKVDFAPKVSAKGRAKVVEIDSVQASHKNGQANPWHFGPDWQPKDRTDEASLLGQNEALNHFDPEKITGDGNAYIESAPSVNERHEVIQGNNRAEILRKLYDGKPEKAAKYKQWLIDNAERFGLDAEEIAKMKRPVLVNELPVDDATAKELGQHDVKEFESGGKATPRTSAVINMLGDKMQSVASILVRQGALPDDAKMSDLIAQNADKVLDYLSKEGVLTATEEQTLRKDKMTLRQWMTDLLKNGLFEGDKLTEASFSHLPDNAQKAVLATYLRDIKSPEGAKIKKNLQRSFDAYVDMMYFPGFANAKNLAEARAAVNMEIEKGNKSLFGEAPVRERYSTFELELAAMYKGLKDQKTLTRLMDKYFDAVQGDKATNRQLELGETPREPISKDEAIKEVFDSYDSTPAETQRQVDEAVKAIATEITKQVGEELVVTDEKVAQKALEEAESNSVAVKKQAASRWAGGEVLGMRHLPKELQMNPNELASEIAQYHSDFITKSFDGQPEDSTGVFVSCHNGVWYVYSVSKEDRTINIFDAIQAKREEFDKFKKQIEGYGFDTNAENIYSNLQKNGDPNRRDSDLLDTFLRGGLERSNRVHVGEFKSEANDGTSRLAEQTGRTNSESDETRTSHLKQLRSKDGDVYGFTDGKKIYLDTKRMKPETALHEYTHLWSEALKRVNPKEWENVKKLFDDVDGLKEEVKKLYPELKGDDLYEEMITTFSGREGTKKLEAVVRELAAKEGKTVTESAKAQVFIGKVKEALQRYWKGVADMLHIHFTTAEEVADKVLADWAKGVDPREIKGGKKDTLPKGKTPIEAAALAYHEEKVSAARKAYEEAKKSGDQSEIKRTRDELKQRLDDKLKAQGIGRKFLNTTFENYDIGNKHDVVVMNPPFGTAGATAIAHLDKAFKHLDEGGRVVAIIPRGSTDKKFDKWFDGQKNAAMRAEVDLPDIVFQQAGTSVRCRVVVVDKITDEALRSKAGYPEKIDLSGHYDKIEDFFEELRDIEMPDRIIDTQAKMQKKARTTARDLKDIKDVRQVTLDKSGITVSLRGEWKDYSINFEGSDNPQTWKEKMKQVYTQFDELEKSTWNEDKQAVCDEMKKLACKLAGMTEEEMQRGRNGNQGGTHLRIEEDGDSSENDAHRNEVEQAVEEWAKSRGYWKDENEKGDFRMETGKTFSGTKENFDGVRDRAVEEKGIVMPNLNKESVKVVHIEKHSFGESEKDILSNAKAWAKENLATKDESNTSIMRDGTHYIISKTAIDKYLSESAVKKSENLDTHISVLPKLTDVIHESIEAEIHPDYKKGEGGSRNVENGYGNNVLVHRLYGAVELDGKTYRVKTTMQEFRGGEENKPHSYEVTKIELLDSPGERENPDKPHSDASNNSISTAKLLNGVEKSYDSGKKLLDESKDLPQGETRFRTNAEPVETISKDAPEVVKHIAEVSKKVGGKVKMVQSAEEVTNPEVKKALDEGKKVSGWYDEKTGEVHLYMPNIHDRYTAEKTIWHEIVGHKGMRGLMGEHFDKFLREVWYDLDNPENAELKKLVDEERRSNPNKKMQLPFY